jgi:AcrR family transcriptional regulator
MAESKGAMVEQYRRDTIQCAAQRVIARHGLGGASMSAIAKEAGVAKGTLYLYFQDRDDLVEHAADRIFDELLDRLKGVLAGGRPLRESLQELVRTKLAFFDLNQEFLRVYVALRLGGSEEAHRHRRRRPRYARYLEMLTEYLAAAARRGEMKAFDPARVALFFAEGTSAILQRRLEETGRPPEEDVEWIVDLLLNGLSSRSRA